MKIQTSKKTALLIFIGTFTIAVAFGRKNEFTREYKKEYPVNENTSLSLDNKYGNIDVMNWTKDRISIQVVLKVNAPNEEKADKLFDQISIEFSQSGDAISANTEFNDDFSKIFGNNGNNLLDIHYTVYMPTDVPMNLVNKYGNVFINELVSTSTIDIKYGNLKANKLLHNEQKPFTEVLLAYSNAEIESCSWIKFDIKYSKTEIKDSKALIILSKYSKVFVDKGTSIVTESKYDTYRLGKISNLLATAGYTNFKAQEISNKILMETRYSDLTVDYVPADFQSIKITTSYGNYKIPIDPSASYKIDGYAKYAKIYVPESAKVSRMSENNEYRVQGVVGTDQNTTTEVTVNSHYGNVKFVE